MAAPTATSTFRAPTVQRRGLVLVAVAAVIWSTGGLIVRSLDTNEAWTTIFYRSLFASVFLVGFVAIRYPRYAVRSFTSMGVAGLLVGACFAMSSIALVVALGLTSVANTLVVVSTAPLLAALLGRVVLGEPVNGRTWATAGVTVVGVVIMVSGSSTEGSTAGDAVAMLIPIGLAVATVTIRRHHEVLMVPAMAVGTMMATLVAVPFVSVWSVTGHDLGLLAMFGSVQLGLGLALYAIGARLAPPADVALVSLLEPVLGPLWVWAVLEEDPGVAALIGGSLVIVAVAIHTAFDLRRRAMPVAA
jgi:drug/metabolite transporter (DMT)-like permease